MDLLQLKKKVEYVFSPSTCSENWN